MCTDIAPTVMSPPVTVNVLDQWGNLNTLASQQQPVTLALNPNLAAATLGGTTTQPSSGGVATFGDLTISASGESMTLQATSGTLQPATSQPFGVFDKTCPANSILLCSGHDKSDTTFVDVQLPDFGTGFTQIAFTRPVAAVQLRRIGTHVEGRARDDRPSAWVRVAELHHDDVPVLEDGRAWHGRCELHLLPQEADRHAVREGPRLFEEPEGVLAAVHLEAESETASASSSWFSLHTSSDPAAGLG